MKAAPILAAFFALSLVPTQAAILITEVYPSGSTNNTYNADWFELTNTGAVAVNITGWKFDDSNPTFATAVGFRGITSIAAGESVVFIDASAAASDAAVQASFTSIWFGSNIPGGFKIGAYSGSGIGLSTGGDAVNIYDSFGTIVAGVTFGSTSTGSTLDNSAGLNGAISTLSTVGVNGAFTSFNTLEVGSPGTFTAVPEPATTAIGFAAITALFVFLRRRKSARA